MKICTKCKTAKSFDSFCMNKNTKSGINSQCKECVANYAKIRKAASADKCLKSLPSHKACTKCKLLLPMSDFSKDIYQHDLKRGNCIKCDALYRIKNKSRINAYSIEYHHKNKEEINSRRARYHVDNIDAQRKSKKEWAKKNAVRIIARARSRKLKIKIINESLPGQWESLIKAYGGKCLFPGCAITKVAMDHVIPLSRGGRHHVSNWQPLCRAHNSGKGTKSTDYRAFVVMG